MIVNKWGNQLLVIGRGKESESMQCERAEAGSSRVYAREKSVSGLTLLYKITRARRVWSKIKERALLTDETEEIKKKWISLSVRCRGERGLTHRTIEGQRSREKEGLSKKRRAIDNREKVQGQVHVLLIPHILCSPY